MPINQLNTVRVHLARGLIAYLLLMYLIWFPLHLQGHPAHANVNTAQQDENNTSDESAPLKDFCRICDWWTLQFTTETLWEIEFTPSCVAFAFQDIIYSASFIEAPAQLIPRAPPVLG